MRWRLRKEKQRGVERWIISRWVKGGKQERLPLSKYRRIRNDEGSLRELVARLNKPITTADAVSCKHAFINDELKGEYRSFLEGKIPSSKGANQEYSYLNRFFLKYFIEEKNLADPLDWYRTHETHWSAFLLSQKMAAKTLRDVVNAANRFMKWLHRRRPEEVPLLLFQPITGAKFRQLEAQRELDGDIAERKYIPPEEWKKIDKKLKNKPVVQACARLAYYWGLRRAETLGMKLSDVKNGYLSVERQLYKIGLYTPLKGRKKRRVDHWFAKPSLAFEAIHIILANPMHKDTLSEEWASVITGYDFHDLRHTWITRAMRQFVPRDVQLGAGHEDIRTTMQYLHDDRTFSDETWTPPEAA